MLTTFFSLVTTSVKESKHWTDCFGIESWKLQTSRSTLINRYICIQFWVHEFWVHWFIGSEFIGSVSSCGTSTLHDKMGFSVLPQNDLRLSNNPLQSWLLHSWIVTWTNKSHWIALKIFILWISFRSWQGSLKRGHFTLHCNYCIK